MRLFTAQQMAAVDRRAIDELGIPGPVLMENAAVGLADALGDAFPAARSVAILCGPGNNGGDGLALARHLDGRGYGVRTILFVGTGSSGAVDPGGDAGLQLRILEAAGLEVIRLTPDDSLEVALDAARAADLVVDALFGTGLSRPLEGRFATLVDGLRTIDTPRLAVDLPSGLAGSSGEPPGPHLDAAVTVTFAAPKLAHILAPAASYCGRVVVTDLGLPAGLLDEAPGSVHLTTADEAAALAPPRAEERDTNKGSFGHLLVVAGRPGGAGAALLTTRAAVRSGTGLVTAAVPSAIRAEVDLGSLESLTLPLPAAADDSLDVSCLERLVDAATGKQALAVGPALGTGDGAFELVRRLVDAVDLPMVLDADALTAFAGRLEALRARTAPTVLTPHPGEMGRLLGVPTAEVQADRLDAARRAADASGCVVVLKGHTTVVAVPVEPPPADPATESSADAVELWLDPNGNNGLATGGSGDVLTGIVGGLLAQGLDSASAARLGVFLHGLAGDLAAETFGRRALAAGDLVDHLAAAWRELLAEEA
ncbi:MAG: NAD(P)H-hydrate dehydratase [Acidobacteriota bacterium]